MTQASAPITAHRRHLTGRALLRRAAVVAAGTVLLAACGGGGGSSAARHGGSTSSTAPASTTTTTPPPVMYTVKRGDTLTAIARQFRVPIAAIVAANHLTDLDHLSEGQSLVIPPAPPTQLVITPPAGAAGQAFQFVLDGAKPSEVVTFQIQPPNGQAFNGPPHTATVDGEVMATYQTAPGASSGPYTVVANGNQGTVLRATFRIGAVAATTTTTGPSPVTSSP